MPERIAAEVILQMDIRPSARHELTVQPSNSGTSMRKFLLSIACGTMLAGCHYPSADIMLTPAAIEDCGAGTKPVALTVRWQVGKANPDERIRIWVSNRPVPAHAGVFDPPFGSVWLDAPASGTSTTGSWVLPGMTITITDPGRGYVLRQVRVPSRPCTARANLRHEQPR
jgi:hypothetical protein